MVPEYLRAFVVILTLSGLTFVAIRNPVLSLGMTTEDFARRRNVWLIATSAAFLAHSFWVFTLVLIPVLLYARRLEQNPFALYLFVLFAVPPFDAALSGLGIVNQLFELSYPRLLSLLVLLPWAVQSLSKDTPAFGKRLPDWLLLGYVLLPLYQQWQIDSVTNTMRNALYVFLDALLPYFVASRSLRTVSDRRDALLSLGVACVIMAPIAALEFVKHWLLYSSLPAALGMAWDGGVYLGRGSTLRAIVTAGHPIVLGYIMMIGILLYLALRTPNGRDTVWRCGLAALIVGVIAPMSRGPWIGALAGVVVFYGTGPAPVKQLLKLSGVGLVLVGVIMVSPWGSSLIQYLPFVGEVDKYNVDFRERLFELSLLVISQSPWFGSPFFMYAAPLQELRNGGMIDIVNSYLLVALQTGYIGLTLFLGVFACAFHTIVSGFRAQPADRDAEPYAQGRAILATLAAIMISIATMSPIGFVPLMYWCVAGMAIGYRNAAQREPSAAPSVASPHAAHVL